MRLIIGRGLNVTTYSASQKRELLTLLSEEIYCKSSIVICIAGRQEAPAHYILELRELL